MGKCRIGIVANLIVDGQGVERYSLSQEYVHSLEKTGAELLMLPMTAELPAWYFELCDGFLIPGGMDVDPTLYGQEQSEKVTNVWTEFDRYQIRMIQEIMKREKPFLAICRGIQIVNVAMGGTLIQHIDGHEQTEKRGETSHTVSIVSGTKLYELLGKECRVNSYHHQVIDQPAPGLVVSAWSEGDAAGRWIEGAEVKDYPFGLCVQWHPEVLYSRSEEMGTVFEALVKTACVQKLFDDWQETMIWSCLQGVMGQVYTGEADAAAPRSALAALGDFCACAGEADAKLISDKALWRDRSFLIMVPQNQQWAQVIETVYQEHARKVTRYAIKKEAEAFDKVYLEHVATTIPDGYRLSMMDEACYQACKSASWSRDLVSQYPTWEMYQQLGLGAVIQNASGEIVSGASSYSTYREGIEIEIDTREDCRRQGLALICGARLILECLNRGLYPSWDAQNPGSVALAEKLGYHLDHEYVAYEVELIYHTPYLRHYSGTELLTVKEG